MRERPSLLFRRDGVIILSLLFACSDGDHDDRVGHQAFVPDTSQASQIDMRILDRNDLSVNGPADALVTDAMRQDMGSADDSMVHVDADILRDTGSISDAEGRLDSQIEAIDSGPEIEPIGDVGSPLDSQIEAIDAGPEMPPTRAQRIAEILRDFGLMQMRIRFPNDDIDVQVQTYPGMVDFPEALSEAINSFLEDGTDEESPRSLANDVRDGPCLDEDLRERVRCFLNRETALLELYGTEGFAPENREPIDQNWIFILRAESLSDHIQWAIVDRAGVEPTYNYGFN